MEVKFLAFSILDVKSDVYSPPFFMQTVGQAMRAFKVTVNDQESQVGRFPEDFKLMRIGEFDGVRGLLTACEPTSLGFATEFKERSSEVVPLGKVSA